MTDEPIPPTPDALDEALELASEIMGDIELGSAPLAAVALKASRLARLVNDFDHQTLFKYEAGGYPSAPNKVPPDVWRLAVLAGRTYTQPGAAKEKTLVYLASVDRLAEEMATGKLALGVAGDRDVSISSSNPYQTVITPPGNFMERFTLRNNIDTATARLASRRALIHDYATRHYYGLKFAGAAQDVFATVRARVDDSIGRVVPSATQKFAAVHDNLRSENPEDWSNAVHSCRRILQDLADSLFPPTDEVRSSGGKEIKLGKSHVINRLVCYAEDHSSSTRFNDLVGSHLKFLGDRLDAVFHAAQKGSHANVSRDEANRYVVYTYLIVGDILSLAD